MSDILFANENVYPQNREDLSERLPDLYDAAIKLMGPLVERALQLKDIEVKTIERALPLIGESRELYQSDDPDRFRDHLATQASRATKYSSYATEVYVPFEGSPIFSARSSMGSRLLHPQFSAVTASFFTLPATYSGRLGQSQTYRNYQSMTTFTKDESCQGINVFGAATGDKSTSGLDGYSMTSHEKNGEIYELNGEPIVNPGASLSPPQKQILERHGPYGLVFDDAKSHLRVMHLLATSRSRRK